MAYRPSSASASESEDDRPPRTNLPFAALRPSTAAPVVPSQPIDADERFKQLLAEYQKLKSNNAVLKKAVLQEQERSTGLEAAVKEKEQRGRQSMEENDLLQFNNERLEKRVAILLKEIDDLKRAQNQTGGWFSGGSKQQEAQKQKELNVLREELMAKIDQSAQLHTTLVDLKKEHESTIRLLEEKLNQLKRSLQVKHDELEDSNISNGKLTAERDALQAQRVTLTQQLAMLKQEKDDLEIATSETKARLMAQITQLQELLAEKVYFDDTRDSDKNLLNVPPFDRKSESTRLDLLNAVLTEAKELFAQHAMFNNTLVEKYLVVNKHASTETLKQKLRFFTSKLVVLLPQYKDHFDRLIAAYTKMLNEAKVTRFISPLAKKEIADSFAKFVNFNGKVLIYQQLRLSEERNDDRFPASMKMRNELLSGTLRTLHLSLSKLNSYIALALTEHPAHEDTLTARLVAALNSVKNATRTYATQLASLVAQENKDGTFVAGPASLKSFNDKLSAASSSIVTFTGRVVSSYEDFSRLSNRPMDLYVKGARVRADAPPPSAAARASKARRFMTTLNAIEKSPTVPYEVALMNASLIPKLESDNKELLSAIAGLKDQVAQLEKEKEALRLEALASKDQFAAKQSQFARLFEELSDTRDQLATSKAAEQRRSEELRALSAQHNTRLFSAAPPLPTTSTGPTSSNSASSLISFDEAPPPTNPTVPAIAPLSVVPGENTTSPSASPAVSRVASVGEQQPIAHSKPSPSGARYSITVLDPSGQQYNTLRLSPVDKEREEQLRVHYEARCQHLAAQITLADEKAQEIHAKLTKEVQGKQSEVNAARKKVTEAEELLRAGKEDLEITRSNYEGHIKLLSENLIERSETLAARESDMQQLRAARVFCPKCKALHTVETLVTKALYRG